MGGRFGKYGDIKRKARIRRSRIQPNRSLQKKLVNPNKGGRRMRRSKNKQDGRTGSLPCPKGSELRDRGNLCDDKMQDYRLLG